MTDSPTLRDLTPSTRALFPFIERIFADGGYQGPRAAEAAAATGKWIIEIVKRNELHKFVRSVLRQRVGG